MYSNKKKYYYFAIKITLWNWTTIYRAQQKSTTNWDEKSR